MGATPFGFGCILLERARQLQLIASSARASVSAGSLWRAMDEDDEYLLKVLVVGDVAVGKTSIIERFANDVFREDYKTTIGVEFSLNSIEVDGKTANVQLWDIAGQERF